MSQRSSVIKIKLLAGAAVVVMLAMILIAVDGWQRAKQQDGLSDNLKLKAPKEKIIDYKLQVIDNYDGAGQPASVVRYRYVSNKEVLVANYQGLEEDLSKRTKNSQTFLKSVKPINDKLQEEEYVSKFYGTQIFQKSGDRWYYIESATTTPQAFVRQTKLTLLDKAKELVSRSVLADGWLIYSGAGDGYVSNSDDSSWSTVHDASIGGGVVDYNQFAFIGAGYNNLTEKYAVYRAFLPFDTSSIPSDTTITSATLNVYTELLLIINNANDGKDYLGVVQTTQGSSTSLVTKDFNEAGATTSPTLGADTIDITDISAQRYHTFTLDATGRGWIKKSGQASACGTTAGITCLGIREGHDIENISASVNVVAVRTSEDNSGYEDPYLTVNYTVTAPAVIKINGGAIKINGGRIKID